MRFRSQLGNYLNTLNLVNIGVELGVHTGQFSRQLLQSWKGQKLWLVDPWIHLSDYLDSFNASDQIMERRFLITQKKLASWISRVEFLRDRSENAVTYFRDESCDFVYIDANHSYKHVTNDLNLWYPKVKKGGLLAGHDYFDAFADNHLEPIFCDNADPNLLTSYGAKSAVNEFAQNLNIEFKITKEIYPTWYFIKP